MLPLPNLVFRIAWYVEDGTEYCEVMVHIGASGRFPEMDRGVLPPPGPICLTPIDLLLAKP
jgi:hypothetical protein